MAPLISVHNAGRTDFCTELKPLQSSSPVLAGVYVELEPAPAGSVACAVNPVNPVSPAMPSSSAAVPATRSTTRDLNPGTCNRPLNWWICPRTVGTGTSSFIVRPAVACYRFHQFVLLKIAICSYLAPGSGP